MFKFSFKKLGPIQEGIVELGPFTIICGRNNVGKTYISHAIYACLVEARKLLLSLDFYAVQVALKSDRESKLNFGVQVADVRKYLPSIKDISSKVSSSLSNGGLAKFFNSDSILNEVEINFEINIDIDALIYDEIIEIQRDFDFLSFTCHKPKNSYEITTTYRITDNGLQDELGPAFFTLVSISEVVNSLINLDPCIATSERTGIALFQPIFDSINTKLGREVYETKKLGRSTKHITTSILKLNNLPQPVVDNIEFIRLRETKNTLTNLKNRDFLGNQLSKLSGGNFIEKSNSVEFKPLESNISIPFSMASSSSKSLYLIEKFIKTKAKPGSILIIDEPELNLHIDNQLQMANLLASLVNSDVQVIITTHSDHMLREINTLMMLGSELADPEEKSDIISEYEIEECSILNPEDIKAYVVSSKEKKVFGVKKTRYGLDLELFNREIISNNKKIREIQQSLFD
jgi:predicted ATPase